MNWRLIDTGPLDGATNMAIDEALLACFEPERSKPVLRLYGWNPSALSLGRFQNASEVLDLDRCHGAGVPLVRRITGGGVIYHAEELTYSLVCAPRHIPAATSVKESFRLLTAFLLGFYRGLGLRADYAVDHLPAGTSLGERTAFCFAGKESYDILIAGRKIGGNAQRRLKNAIFQHGSIPLGNKSAEGAGFLREVPAGVAESTTSLGDEGVPWEDAPLKGLLASAFRQSQGTELVADALTPGEEDAARGLLGKYRGKGWTMAGEWDASRS